MENVESIDISNDHSGGITRTQFGEKFAALRQEGEQKAAQQRLRLQRLANASALSSATAEVPSLELHPLRAEPRNGSTTPQDDDPTPSPALKAPEPKHPAAPPGFDLIALWSVVGPSTITAVFGGVAMSGSNVPLPYAIVFILAWFALTSGLAIGALHLFNTRKCASLLSVSTPRLGMAAIACALISVLTVEAARLSITALAEPARQHVSVHQDEPSSPVLAAPAQKTSNSTAVRSKPRSIARSVHYPSTPDIISAATDLPNSTVANDATVVALPAPVPSSSLQLKQTAAASDDRAAQQNNDQLLGRISNKGKFLTHRTSSRWSRSTSKTARTRRQAAPDTRNFLEKIFNPIINSANAKAPKRRIRSSSDDLAEFSR